MNARIDFNASDTSHVTELCAYERDRTGGGETCDGVFLLCRCGLLWFAIILLSWIGVDCSCGGGCCRSLCFSLVPLLAFSFCARLRRGGTCGGVLLLLRVRIALAHDNTVVVGRSGLLLWGGGAVVRFVSRWFLFLFCLCAHSTVKSLSVKGHPFLMELGGWCVYSV